MRVVVAGGAGFLGSHLCRALLARGDQVVCMDNLITGNMDNVSELFGGAQSGHWRMLYEAMHDFLVVLDNNCEPVNRLAAEAPSRERGWRCGQPCVYPSCL